MKTIKLDHITKIEGHAQLSLKIDKNEIKSLDLEVFEGARYFEAIVRDRRWDEAPVLTSRICGTCSPIHVITSLRAVEDAFGIKVSKQTSYLRELMALGSMIQNHVSHLYFLALPDYLGYGSALEMAGKYKKDIMTALKLRKVGYEIVRLIGGREIHPMTAVVGGFSKLPNANQIKDMLNNLMDARNDALYTAQLFQKLKYPQFERQRAEFALRKDNEYPFIEGQIGSLDKKTIKTHDYDKHFKEYIEKDSSAKFAVVEGKSYMVGAIARVNINYRNLSYNAKRAARIKPPYNNPFLNNVAQAIEIVHAIDRCISILKDIKIQDEPQPQIVPKKGVGIGVSEAPRGLVFHKYEFDGDGIIRSADIITPTSQNLKSIEDDLLLYIPTLLRLPEDKLILEIEKLIRSYDPCISCSAHFLKVNFL